MLLWQNIILLKTCINLETCSIHHSWPQSSKPVPRTRFISCNISDNGQPMYGPMEQRKLDQSYYRRQSSAPTALTIQKKASSSLETSVSSTVHTRIDQMKVANGRSILSPVTLANVMEPLPSNIVSCPIIRTNKRREMFPW